MTVAVRSARQLDRAAREPAANAGPMELLLREILAGQATLHAKLDALLARGRQPSSLSREDRVLLARLLPAIGGAYGPERFSSRDLVEDTRPAVHFVVRGLSVKQISKLFARADGMPIDGLMVQKQGVEFHVMAWQIVAC